VIVATVALSTMVCNDLVMPALLRIKGLKLAEWGDLTGLLLFIRRAAIVSILMLGYGYFRFIGEADALVTIGLVSFAAAAQFAPAIFIGIFWKGASEKGAFVGLALGFLVWSYTLVLPFFARPGWLSPEFIVHGPFGIAALKPYELFGLSGLDSLTHAMFWSMLVNAGSLVLVSLWGRQSALERVQAVLFVDVFRWSERREGSPFWRGSATIADLHSLVARFVGERRANQSFAGYAQSRKIDFSKQREADPDLVNFTERLLAGAIGAASARVMVGTVAKGELVSIEEMLEILEETSQVIEHSQSLEQKSRELEATTSELRAANERLQELDRLKDDFLSNVSHELRTPLTSIRSFSEILSENPNLEGEERDRFLSVIVKESERLTRLINQILDLAKIEADNLDWMMEEIDPKTALDDALAATSGLFAEEEIDLHVTVTEPLAAVRADRDRLIQVIVNLLSNAAKFSARPGGKVRVKAESMEGGFLFSIKDNGRGVAAKDRDVIFERFQQASETLADKPHGTGLGLAISRQIIEFFEGRIWVESAEGGGACFIFTLPSAEALGRRHRPPLRAQSAE